MVFLLFVILITLLIIILFIRDLKRTAQIKSIDNTLKTYIENGKKQTKEEAGQTSEARKNSDSGN